MRLDQSSAECRVFTFKEGLLSPLGHDLELRVTRFTLEVSDDRSAVEGRFDAGSLRVVGAVGQPDALSSRDRASIEKTIADEVLRARKYPEILFRSSAVEDGQIRGTLTLAGRSREITLRRETSGARQTASARLEQPDFGIAPYRAMFGALRVRADVRVQVTVTLS